ncbi:hypothetical protein DPMN_107590 [Dreissena polymorpha]|uniref:2'-5'-oligoadenylate synthetase 1 domain-containing protein n=1 Tax=Dreissena polymorpha TaxID=45954 RepID=A0A9D4QKB2_DREPO|nr:hypothetical protein DPMN_107590 [Dreissena polymorpha]
MVKLTNGNFSHSVDVILGIDLLDRGMAPDQVLDQMQGPEVDKHLYSVTLAPLQVEVIQALPTKVKDLIRIIKYWEDVKMKAVRNCKWPSSFAMELVVMHAWNNAGSPSTSFSMVRALHAVLTSLVNHRQFMATFPRQMKYSSVKLETCLQRRRPPYIMDPTNPFNDMYHGLFDTAWDWNDVATEASTWLRHPLFRGVTGTNSRW